MFNKPLNFVKRIPLVLVAILLVTACHEDVQLHFEKQQVDHSADAKIIINYPKAVGTTTIAKKINDVIEHTITADMNMSETEGKNLSVEEAASEFNKEFKKFKTDFQDTHQQWEVKVDGDVAYESAEVISVIINSYVDTGGAHGNSVVTYLNFNPETGALFDENDIFKDPNQFKTVAESAFKEQTKPKDADETMEDFFFGEDFQLPANFGFNKEGLVLLYNNYEIASYAQGTTKIFLPYAEIKNDLKINP